MKILVSGATGGLGQLVIEELLKRGHSVIASSRDVQKAQKLSFFNQITYKSYNINQPENQNLFEYFERPDALIHLAWEKLNEYKNEAHLHSILQNHKIFLSNLLTHGLKDITVAGTVYEYGLREGELEENMPAMPTMPYPQAKNLLREFLEDGQKKNKFSLKWLRIFYVFGEIKERKNLYTLLNDAVAKGDEIFNMSGGEQIRDFLSPKQIAVILCAATCQNKVEGIINCCSGQPVKLKDMVMNFLRQRGYNIKLNLGFYPYPDYEPMQTWGSVKKLEAIYSNLHETA